MGHLIYTTVHYNVNKSLGGVKECEKTKLPQ